MHGFMLLIRHVGWLMGLLVIIGFNRYAKLMPPSTLTHSITHVILVFLSTKQHNFIPRHLLSLSVVSLMVQTLYGGGPTQLIQCTNSCGCG